MMLDKKSGIIGAVVGVDEAELVLRLNNYFTAKESLNIIRMIKANKDEPWYDHDDFLIMYSVINMSYSIFISSIEYSELVTKIDLADIKPPRSIRDDIEDLVLFNNQLLDKSEVDYIMNCRAIYEHDRDPQNSTTARLVWLAYRTLLEKQRKEKRKKNEKK